MANPQKEAGYTPIANEILEAFGRTRIPGEARQVLDVIIRLTYGWGRSVRMISYSQFMEMTGLSARHVYRSIQSLLIHRMIDRSAQGYRLQKDYERWLPYSKRGYSNNGVPQSGGGGAPKMAQLPAPKKESPTGKNINYSNRMPEAKERFKEKDKEISLREILADLLKKKFKRSFDLPKDVSDEKLDYLLYQIEKGKVSPSRIKIPAAYLKSLEITESFVPYRERMAREEELRKKDRAYLEGLASTEKVFDPETGRRMVRQLIDSLDGLGPDRPRGGPLPGPFPRS